MQSKAAKWTMNSHDKLAIDLEHFEAGQKYCRPTFGDETNLQGLSLAQAFAESHRDMLTFVDSQVFIASTIADALP